MSVNREQSHLQRNNNSTNDDDDDEQQQQYLHGLAQSFDHTEFQSNVRQILRLRRHALENSGPSKEEYYQGLVESYKKQQEKEAESQQEIEREKFLQAELEKVIKRSSSSSPSSSSNTNQLDYEAKRIKLQMLMNKNNVQAAQARQRIRDAFGEDYSSAGHALLHGERLPETAKFAGCTVTSTGSRGTLWARTLKQWRQEKANEMKQTEDSRASEAMAAVDAKVRIEQMKSRMTGDEVQAWAAQAINEQLSDKTRSAVGRIQSVIEHAKKMEKRRLRRDYLKDHPEEEDKFVKQKKTTYRQQQEAEIFRLANAGGDFTKNMSPELHGLWLRSLLPGMKIGGMSGQSGYSDDDDDDEDDSSDDGDIDHSNKSRNRNRKILQKGEYDEDGLPLFDQNGKRVRKETKKERREREGISVNSQLFTSYMDSSLKTGEKDQEGKQSMFFPDTAKTKLHKQKVDPKLLEKESIRERARRVLFGGVTTISTEIMSNSDAEQEQEQEQEESKQQLSRKASSVFSVDSSSKQQDQQQHENPKSNNNSLVNTPALSNVDGQIEQEENLFSPDREQIVQHVVEVNNNHHKEQQKVSPPESNDARHHSSKTPSFMNSSSDDEDDDENENGYYSNKNNSASTSSIEYLRARQLDQMLKNKKKADALLNGNNQAKKKSYLEQRREDFEEVVGGVNVTLEKTAKDAHKKILRLLDAETHGNVDDEEKNRQFSRMQDAAARRKYLNATKHWGDSRHALVWDFELEKIKEEVSLGRHRNNNNNNNNNHQSKGHRESSSEVSSALVGYNQERSPVSNQSSSVATSTSSSPSGLLSHHSQKSERIQKIERTIELLEQGKIGNVVQKKKFNSRLERNGAIDMGASSHMGMSVASVTSVLFGANNSTSNETALQDKSTTTNALIRGRSYQSTRTNNNAGNNNDNTNNNTLAALYGTYTDVLSTNPKAQPYPYILSAHLPFHLAQQVQQQHSKTKEKQEENVMTKQNNSNMNNNNNNNNNKDQDHQDAATKETTQKVVPIPFLDNPHGKYQGALDMRLDHFDPQTGKPVSLRATNMPEPDLFEYQKYAREKNMIIIIRPVSQVVPQLYATPGLHIKGKSINVSLKSSSYRPIDGLIPVNPALGKAYLDAMRREREIEDMMSNATGGVVTVSLLKRLRAQKAAAGSLTQAFRRDIINSLDRSERELKTLMEQYTVEIRNTIDKLTVSKNYIERFNEAQFLGTTHAKYKEKGIFYRDAKSDTMIENIERDANEAPVFYIESSPQQFFKYNPDSDTLDEALAEKTEQLHPVMVVTHRMFTISGITNRIEEDPTLYMIGPDFDGLAYARRVDLDVKAKDRIAWAEKINDYKLNRTMGLVNEFDVEHVREVRVFTDWKQNHGYECGNTVKTQPISLAAHAVITPDSFSVLNTVFEIVSYMRTAWRFNIPLLVNPNWRVVLDDEMLPRLYGDELALPVVDDCGASATQTRFEVERKDDKVVTYDNVKREVGSMQHRYEAEVERRRLRTKGGAGGGAGGKAGGGGGVAAATATIATNEEVEGSLEDAVKLVVDKKYLSELFFQVRRWQLMPPIFVPSKTKRELLDKLKKNVPLPLDVLETQLKQHQKYSSSHNLGLDLTKEESSNVTASDAANASPSSPTNTNLASSSQEALRSKFFSSGGQFDGRTKWNAPIEDPEIDQEFEKARREKVSHYLVAYEQGKEWFLYLHTEKSSVAFVANLDDYLFPEKYVKS